MRNHDLSLVTSIEEVARLDKDAALEMAIDDIKFLENLLERERVEKEMLYTCLDWTVGGVFTIGDKIKIKDSGVTYNSYQLKERKDDFLGLEDIHIEMYNKGVLPEEGEEGVVVAKGMNCIADEILYVVKTRSGVYVMGLLGIEEVS